MPEIGVSVARFKSTLTFFWDTHSAVPSRSPFVVIQMPADSAMPDTRSGRRFSSVKSKLLSVSATLPTAAFSLMANIK